MTSVQLASDAGVPGESRHAIHVRHVAHEIDVSPGSMRALIALWMHNLRVFSIREVAQLSGAGEHEVKHCLTSVFDGLHQRARPGTRADAFRERTDDRFALTAAGRRRAIAMVTGDHGAGEE